MAHRPQRDEGEVLLESLAELFVFTRIKEQKAIFVLICTFFSNFLGPEAFRGPSCFFKTQKMFDIIPLVP
jgi:hypothetical protein